MKIQTKLTLVAVALILGSVAYLYLTSNKSEGDRVGTVTKCSKKGLIFKTHECDLASGGISSGGGLSAINFWSFTVLDTDWDGEVGKVLTEAMNTGEPVKVSYIQPRVTNPARTDTGYYAVAVTTRGVGSIPPSRASVE